MVSHQSTINRFNLFSVYTRFFVCVSCEKLKSEMKGKVNFHDRRQSLKNLLYIQLLKAQLAEYNIIENTGVSPRLQPVALTLNRRLIVRQDRNGVLRRRTNKDKAKNKSNHNYFVGDRVKLTKIRKGLYVHFSFSPSKSNQKKNTCRTLRFRANFFQFPQPFELKKISPQTFIIIIFLMAPKKFFLKKNIKKIKGITQFIGKINIVNVLLVILELKTSIKNGGDGKLGEKRYALLFF